MKLTTNNFDNFTFESYGVPVRVECSDPELLTKAQERARRALVGNFRVIDPINTSHIFRLEREGSTYRLIKDNLPPGPFESEELLLKHVDSMVRITVAEYAVDKVFVHAGVVGWKGRGIVIPGDSYSGKTTLVAELLKCGADYYSDEYAVFDKEGLVHPFARDLAMRSRPVEGKGIEVNTVKADDLGGRTGVEPIVVSHILITEFREDAEWRPEILTAGQGTLEMLSQTVPIRYAPEFSIKVLKKVSANAIIIKNFRFEAEKFARFFFDFVDNKAL